MFRAYQYALGIGKHQCDGCSLLEDVRKIIVQYLAIDWKVGDCVLFRIQRWSWVPSIVAGIAGVSGTVMTMDPSSCAPRLWPVIFEPDVNVLLLHFRDPSGQRIYSFVEENEENLEPFYTPSYDVRLACAARYDHSFDGGITWTVRNCNFVGVANDNATLHMYTKCKYPRVWNGGCVCGLEWSLTTS